MPCRKYKKDILMPKLNYKKIIATTFNWGCIFAGDLIPYLSIFLMTLIVSYFYSTEYAKNFNLVYSYSAMILAIFAAPSLVSLKRRLAHTETHGVVLLAGSIIRITGLLFGGSICLVYFLFTPHLFPLLYIWSLVFIARVLETSVDIPAIVVQYCWSPFKYFLFRLLALVILSSILVIFSYFSVNEFYQLLICYIFGALVIASLATLSIKKYWRNIDYSIHAEILSQLKEIAAMFVAVCMYVASTRLYIIIIGEYWGVTQAAEFATVQNVTAVAGLLASAFAGSFFWSRNKLNNTHSVMHLKSLRDWIGLAIVFGLLVGLIVALATEKMVLLPLNMSKDLVNTSWIICMATPLLALQALISNYFLIIKKDNIMFLLAFLSSVISIMIMFILIPYLGLLGAAISMCLASSISVLLGLSMVWWEKNYANSSSS